MDAHCKRNMQYYINARREHPAWQLLASNTAPSVLSALQSLFENQTDGVDIELAIATLAESLQAQHQRSDLDITNNDFAAEAHKELRKWIRRGLVVERKGRVLATDALQKALHFIDSLDNQIMTSTASRLATVQREIEQVDATLNPNPKRRVEHIEQKIRGLESELDAAKAGHFEVLSGEAAIERIREIYYLASSLRNDFRRVEDSYRQADKQLRESIISEGKNRGDIVDKLLDNHDSLLDTVEGRVFYNFHQQLSRSIELDDMSERLKTILSHPQASAALSPAQQQDLRWLKIQLVKESQTVIKARARSERDVKGFIKTGLAAEHHRVGQVLQALFSAAVDVDWSSQALRREDSPLPPVAVASTSVPVIERLRIKEIVDDDPYTLDLSEQTVDLAAMDSEFWSSFDSLDRNALLQDTRSHLKEQGNTQSMAALASHFQPQHDLEAIGLWLSLVREADLPVPDEREQVAITFDDEKVCYRVPKVGLNTAALHTIDWETFEA